MEDIESMRMKVLEIKNILNGINSSLDTEEENMSKFDIIAIEIILNQSTEWKMLKINEQGSINCGI